MLRSIKKLYEKQLGAADGEIGRVKDCYFDGQTWALRYLVVDTGKWLPGRKVLIPPHSLVRDDPKENFLTADLTLKQIEGSPAMEAHKPVSRQYEEQYHYYFGWPYYWEGEALLGLDGVQIPKESLKPLPGEPTVPSHPQIGRTDGQLRSTQAVDGYHLQTDDEIIGHVSDFMLDTDSWAIGQLVVRVGHRLSGAEVWLPVDQVDRISWEESTVFVSLSREAVEKCPAPRLEPSSVAE